jgi:hypothetical protein
MTSAADYRHLSARYLQDARALFASGRHAGAYYMAGYAVECALKACACRALFRNYTASSQKLVTQFYKHDFRILLRCSGLEMRLAADRTANPTLRANWDVVFLWSVDVRYEAQKARADVRDMLEAMQDRPDGVLEWLARFY